jgi:hypothetical protein
MMILFNFILVLISTSASSYAWDFSLPKDIESVPEVAQRTFFNYTTLGTSGSLAVVNKTTAANTVGVILASAFLAGTLIYTLEENQASSSSAKLSNRVDGFLSDFFSASSSANDDSDSDDDSKQARAGGKKDKKRRKKKVEKTDCSDCETYCYNKYYYGDPYHTYGTPTADGSTYSKRYAKTKQKIPLTIYSKALDKKKLLT